MKRERKRLYRKIRNHCNISKYQLDVFSLKELKNIWNKVNSRLDYEVL